MSNSSEVEGRGAICPSPFDIALYLFVTICPIFVFLPLNMDIAQGFFYNFGVFALWAISLFCKKERDTRLPLIGCMLILAMVSVFWNSLSLLGNTNAMYHFLNFATMYEGFIFLLASTILYYLIYCYKKDFDIRYPVILLNIINLIFIVLQKCNIHCIWQTIPTKVSGMFGIAPHLGIFSALSIPLLFNFRFKEYWIPVVLIPITNLLVSFANFNYSFAGVVSLYLAVFLYLRHKKMEVRKWLWVSLMTPLFVSKSDWVIEKLAVRFNVWWVSLKEIATKPLGYGFDTTLNNGMVYSWYTNSTLYRHSDILQVTRDLGILFTTLIGVFIIRHFKEWDYKNIAIAVILIASCLWTSLYFVRIGMFLVVLLALKRIDNGYQVR